MKDNSQRGVALVITLILLSVITFMAVTFLVISRHEGSAVDAAAQQSNAKFAAESAAQQAMAQIMANMLNSGNGYGMGLYVSTNLMTNFYSGTGPGTGTNLTDVSYNDSGGNPLSVTAGQQMLNNLLILPRAPVFIKTNSNPSFPLDFRFYLDLNRNGRFDSNGLVAETNYLGNAVLNAGVQVFSNRVGDPEWIGILNHSEYRHSPSNYFTGRMCYIALPIGNSLDANYIHNHAKQFTANGPSFDGFMRNQGFGTWEINFAGFLNSLISTNGSRYYWNYNYNTNVSQSSDGNSPTYNGDGIDAFADANGLLNYRYNQTFKNLLPFKTLYGGTAAAQFDADFIDGYCVGPILLTNLYQPADLDAAMINSSYSWLGADNPSQYATIEDLFNKSSGSLSNHLAQVGQAVGTDDCYAFYRMLSQLGVGSSTETDYPYTQTANSNYFSVYGNQPKMNLNYKNVGGFKATNFVGWTNLDFFTNAADRMLRAYFPNPIMVTNGNSIVTNYLSINYIPLYVGNASANLYTPAVHRILQLAANMFEASTNNTGKAPSDFDYPDVFMPTFNKIVTNGVTVVYISGYQLNTDHLGGGRQAYQQQPLALPDDLALIGPGTVNIYGAPYIIGTKNNHFPSFNQLQFQTTTLLTRRVQLTRLHQGDPVNKLQTNIQYSLIVSNLLGCSAWNPYVSNIPRSVQIIGSDFLSMYLNVTDDVKHVSGILALTNLMPIGFGPTNYTTNMWPGINIASSNPNQNAPSFIPFLNMGTNLVLSNNIYHITGSVPFLSSNSVFDISGFIQPRFYLFITNRLRYIMTDIASGRVVDYLTLNMNDGTLNRDLMSEVAGPANAQGVTGGDGGVWITNRVSADPLSPIIGVNNQIAVSQGNPRLPLSQWAADQLVPGDENSEISGFNTWYLGTTNTSVQVPFTPTRIVNKAYYYAANDPFVHYTLPDLTLPNGQSIRTNYLSPGVTTNLSLTTVSPRYSPWGNGPHVNQNPSFPALSQNYMIKDPLITKADDWQFPTNKYPNVGWLGRVHRGTPWQTVYLKSPQIDLGTWTNWSGNTQLGYYGGVLTNDAFFSLPYQDWLLMDLFTAAPNDNASHGQLPINQSGLAAWAAVLDGVMVVTNSANGQPLALGARPIDPTVPILVNGSYTNAVQSIVNSINAVRPAGGFTSLGQILAVSNLTVSSPYLITNASSTSLLRDADYERIPQQIMGLLRLGTPRYAIYAYGQSLKPADGSIVTSGPFFGMCTNYQITGEVATRTIVRFDGFPYPGAPAGTVFQPRPVVESFTVLGPE